MRKPSPTQRARRRRSGGPALECLDRLIDEAPDKPDEPDALDTPRRSPMLRSNLRRDLEALLNAHRRWRSGPHGYDELQRSPLGWGIADFTAGAFNDPRTREELRTEIEDAIRTFETASRARAGEPARFRTTRSPRRCDCASTDCCASRPKRSRSPLIR